MNTEIDLIFGPTKIYYKDRIWDYESIKIYHDENLIYESGNSKKMTNIVIYDDKFAIGEEVFNIDVDFKIFHNYTLIYKYQPIKRRDGLQLYRVRKS